MSERINNIHWLDRYNTEHQPGCGCDVCANRWSPRIAAAVIIGIAMACWVLVAAVVVSVL